MSFLTKKSLRALWPFLFYFCFFLCSNVSKGEVRHPKLEDSKKGDGEDHDKIEGRRNRLLGHDNVKMKFSKSGSEDLPKGRNYRDDNGKIDREAMLAGIEEIHNYNRKRSRSKKDADGNDVAKDGSLYVNKKLRDILVEDLLGFDPKSKSNRERIKQDRDFRKKVAEVRRYAGFVLMGASGQGLGYTESEIEASLFKNLNLSGEKLSKSKINWDREGNGVLGVRRINTGNMKDELSDLVDIISKDPSFVPGRHIHIPLVQQDDDDETDENGRRIGHLGSVEITYNKDGSLRVHKFEPLAKDANGESQMNEDIKNIFVSKLQNKTGKSVSGEVWYGTQSSDDMCATEVIAFTKNQVDRNKRVRSQSELDKTDINRRALEMRLSDVKPEKGKRIKYMVPRAQGSNEIEIEMAGRNSNMKHTDEGRFIWNDEINNLIESNVFGDRDAFGDADPNSGRYVYAESNAHGTGDFITDLQNKSMRDRSTSKYVLQNNIRDVGIFVPVGSGPVSKNIDRRDIDHYISVTIKLNDQGDMESYTIHNSLGGYTNAIDHIKQKFETAGVPEQPMTQTQQGRWFDGDGNNCAAYSALAIEARFNNQTEIPYDPRKLVRFRETMVGRQLPRLQAEAESAANNGSPRLLSRRLSTGPKSQQTSNRSRNSNLSPGPAMNDNYVSGVGEMNEDKARSKTMVGDPGDSKEEGLGDKIKKFGRETFHFLTFNKFSRPEEEPEPDDEAEIIGQRKKSTPLIPTRRTVAGKKSRSPEEGLDKKHSASRGPLLLVDYEEDELD